VGDERTHYDVLVMVVAATEYRVDAAYKYRGEKLAEPGDVIEVQDLAGGPMIEARVNRVLPEDQFPIRASELPRPTY
jgi:hypothetical protein